MATEEQEDAYKEVIKTAVGGAAGVIHAVDCATTDCQPNENVEALRVFMLGKKVECRPVWKPMHKQPVYSAGAKVQEVSGVPSFWSPLLRFKTKTRLRQKPLASLANKPEKHFF